VRSLLVFFALVAATAVSGAQFEPGDWYATLSKPPWTPPGWIFGPVWGLLYLAIAVAGWLAWRTDPRPLSAAMVAWGTQLALNAAWSWLFFGRQAPVAALVDIVLLLGAIISFIVVVRSRSTLAAGLFVPYALWVAFAAALNFEIARLNA
jgi:translocator protein